MNGWTCSCKAPVLLLSPTQAPSIPTALINQANMKVPSCVVVAAAFVSSALAAPMVVERQGITDVDVLQYALTVSSPPLRAHCVSLLLNAAESTRR